MLSGIVTAILLLLFVGICIWAFSPRRKRDFDAASRLPLDEEHDGEDAPTRGEQEKRQ